MLLQSVARRARTTPAVSSLFKRGFRVHGSDAHELGLNALSDNHVDEFMDTTRQHAKLSNRNQGTQHHSGVSRETIPGNAPLSTRLRKSPYFDRTISAGVKEFTVYNRMLMPLDFDRRREYKALTEDVAIWDVAAERQVQLKGPDAGKLAQLLTCRDISKLKVGKGIYAVMTDQEGIVINDPVLQKIDEETYWFSIADSDVILWAKGVCVAQGYDVKVTEPDVSPLALQGPKSAALVKELYGDDDLIDSMKHFDFLRDPVRTAITSPTRPDLPPIPTLLARSGWSPELGFEIYLEDSSRGDELWDLCMELGSKYSIFPGAPNQQRRIEAGMLSFGGDTFEDTNALELGLPKRFVDPYMDPDFIGKKSLQKIAEEGVERTFCGFWLLDDSIQEQDIMRGKHLPIYRSMTEDADDLETPVAGALTAITWSPKFQKVIGLGYINVDLLKSNAEVGIKTFGGQVVAAKVTTLPFKSEKTVGGRAASRKE